MKLLVATPIFPPDIGGPATYLAQLIPYMQRRGVIVSVVTFSDGKEKETQPEDRSVTRISRRAALPLRTWRYYRALVREAKDSDLMYVHDMSSVGLAACLASSRRCPFVLRLGGDFVWERAYGKGHTTLGYREFQGREPGLYAVRRRLGSLIVKRARKVIVPSGFLKDVILSWGVSSSHVDVVENAIDETMLYDRPPETELLAHVRRVRDEGKRIVITSGRFVRWKHFDALIASMSGIPGTHLFLVGSGPEESAYRTLIQKERYGDRVHLYSPQSRAALYAALKEADCFALPSEGETFSFVSLEALYAGIPIVLLKKAALPEIFGPYEGRGVTFLPDSEPASITPVLADVSRLSAPDSLVRDELKERYGLATHLSRVYSLLNEFTRV